MAVDTTDIAAATVILVCGLLGIIFPFLPFARKNPSVQRAGEAHSAGLFLALALVHMLADAMDSFNAYKHAHGISDDYPYPCLIAGLTFVLLLSLDILQAKIMSKWHDDEGDPLGIPTWFSITLGVIFAGTSPLALVVAAALNASNNDLAVAWIQAAAAGTFLFLACESMGALKNEHGHDHAMDTSSIGKALFCFAFLTAHSVLDGLVVATGGNTRVDTWILCIAIAFHKLWAAMALGFKLQNASKPVDEQDERDYDNMLLPIEADKIQTLDSPTPRFDQHVHNKAQGAAGGGGCKCVDYTAFIVGFGVLAAVAAVT
eukprot:CAMPEP_0170172052 /NCGR_PEP_ID=MMETSP0040_2-20121228/5277_1 /TAXON_ID=641309 /ORGANISM="Lotharella oceanica, Strain CCMP622" /LENGTH=316 /DNA_ID=CAMNT_0010412499 /DNA_START=48 /DNA_END=998 /DNA_ORIENTATION=+